MKYRTAIYCAYSSLGFNLTPEKEIFLASKSKLNGFQAKISDFKLNFSISSIKNGAITMSKQQVSQ